MAIIITNDGDRIVPDLAARDAYTSPFDGMRITVADSTGDVFTQGGKATYQWNASTSNWLLVWKENKDSLEFVTESQVISGGKAIAANVPQSEMVWGCTVQDVTVEGDSIILAEISPTVSGDQISIGTNVYDGKTLVFTYGYGVIQAAVSQILASGGITSADLALKADVATTFTKTEVNSALALKADASAVYVKADVDSALAAKADQATTYTKTETNAAIQSIVGAAPAALDTLAEIAAQLAADESAAAALTTAVSLKAPLASPTFTGTVSGITKAMVGLGNVDNTADASKPVSTAQAAAIALKADLASPTFTGTPAAPTATAGTNTTQVATTAFVTAADNLKANLASPTFTGTPAAPTAAAGTNTTQVATTAFVLANSVQQTTVNTVTGRIQDSDGNLRSVPFSNKTAAYTLVAADNGKNINITTGGITIPTNSVFAAGDIVSIYNQSGTAQNVSWSGGTVYLMGTSTAKTSPLSLAARGGLTIMFVTGGASPEILVSGNV